MEGSLYPGRSPLFGSGLQAYCPADPHPIPSRPDHPRGGGPCSLGPATHTLLRSAEPFPSRGPFSPPRHIIRPLSSGFLKSQKSGCFRKLCRSRCPWKIPAARKLRQLREEGGTLGTKHKLIKTDLSCRPHTAGVLETGRKRDRKISENGKDFGCLTSFPSSQTSP